ncbi:Phosphoenolpyruvate synthase [uncultured Desulfobacterium sp.]|uniref:Phosphoenolpyruvate synthase n=1 Tax=uncultured Desulfobacterium sp. TaxID=201089 RepID=A0A445MYB3_9BACT|nr:Phosphoenolpyruvate synthase [uncultured Desulfobacterium sp.]
MGQVIKRIRDLFYRKRTLDESEVEVLRNDFQARYHFFKLLLNANNKALEVMSEMEDALRGDRPFGITYVRALCTTVSTNVWQIINNLNQLAQGKYGELNNRFKDIQQNINPFIKPTHHPMEGSLTLSLKEIDKGFADQVGSKMANLGEIRNNVHLKISNGFAITAEAYRRFMEHSDVQQEISRRFQTTDRDRIDQLYGLSAGIQQLIIQSPLPPDLEEAISEQYRNLEKEEGNNVTVVMRSSALGEDFAETSFAGQYRSALNVSGENIHQVYKEIVASKYSLQAMIYRLNRGIRSEDVAMCVGCMTMVKAVSGGVTYSRNPIDVRDDSVYINSVWGLPKTVVDGSAASDLFVVSRGTPLKIVKRDIPIKSQSFVCYPEEGVCRLDLTGEKDKLPSLTDKQALELARIAIMIEDYYGLPQDIEWAVNEDGEIIVLQCRPLRQISVQESKDKYVHEADDDTIIFKGGVTASPGIAAGPAFLARKDVDVLRFPQGAILVTAQALPRWATVLSRASALISEHGSTAGHLANVSREFDVPALFGVEGALDTLENGQMITVDADAQKIYKGRIERLLDAKRPRKILMEGSPVLEALRSAAQYITPLNLLDPASPNFRPRNCTTFHDITRYCHEKVVEEMFQFGKTHHFPERSSKQLFCEVPMQWWILNLDDGFREEVQGKYVRLEDIVSIPMLALWDGIAAIPWEGPPPVDGKGLMSVMFEATTNRALTTGVKSNYANRNYFMISKNYCNLSSRLGFHFSTIEALVSERPSENYISFQFKGGAANFQRRLQRVIFIKEILERYEFRVIIRKDNLSARVEDREMEYMKKRLMVLGYLTIHTRQLDMIMSRDASVSHYRAKIFNDIDQILGLTRQNIDIS